jgi:hypothetical protein
VRRLPGVQNAAQTTWIPPQQDAWSHGVKVGGKQGSSRFIYADPQYLGTMNLPLLTGRQFTDNDTKA